MRVEVLNTGTELLLGSVLNTHPRIFAEALWPLGLRLERQVTVPIWLLMVPSMNAFDRSWQSPSRYGTCMRFTRRRNLL